MRHSCFRETNNYAMYRYVPEIETRNGTDSKILIDFCLRVTYGYDKYG
jgi:hypothetical protein